MKYTTWIVIFISLYANAQTGKEILQSCEDRIRTLKSVSYNIYSENAYEKVTADVVVQRGNDLPIFETARIKVSALALTNSGSKQITFAYNGTSFDFIDPATHELVKLDSPSYNKLGRTGMMMYTLLALPAYWQKDPLRSLIDITAAEKLEDTLVFGNPCYKIKVTRESNSSLTGKETSQSYWFIGKKDQLIHGIRSLVNQAYL